MTTEGVKSSELLVWSVGAVQQRWLFPTTYQCKNHRMLLQECPEKHRLIQVDPIDDPDAYNVEIQNLAKASQAYDRGLERFVGKFDPSTPMTATMAIEKGCHGDYGVAIFFQQEKRRCLHLGTILCAQSDEEAFWFTMMMWALFQPQSATPRMEPG
jgi:hypothetical protein